MAEFAYGGVGGMRPLGLNAGGKSRNPFDKSYTNTLHKPVFTAESGANKINKLSGFWWRCGNSRRLHQFIKYPCEFLGTERVISVILSCFPSPRVCFNIENGDRNPHPSLFSQTCTQVARYGTHVILRMFLSSADEAEASFPILKILARSIAQNSAQ
jgi:hypothetical protein